VIVSHNWASMNLERWATLSERREKGSSLNSAFLTPKPLASSVYVHVLEAPSPLKRSILVTSPFPSPVLRISRTSASRYGALATKALSFLLTASR
jgi:hypothetical protein